MKRKAAIIGVPMDWGASKKGASGGPAAVRRANIVPALKELDLSVEDWGDVKVSPLRGKTDLQSKQVAAILRVCKELEKMTHTAMGEGNVPIVLGGDHSLSLGSVAGGSRALRDEDQKMGLIWVDAHADINTPDTSASGNLHGMPLAHILNMGSKLFNAIGGSGPKIEARNVCLVGIRDVEKKEAANLRRSGIRVFSMQDIDRFGLGLVIEQAIDIASDGTAGLHLSFDIDCVDPGQAPGTGTLKRGGLTYREAHMLMELIADSERLLGLNLVEVNPLEDTHNATAELAVELISSAMGKNIY